MARIQLIRSATLKINYAGTTFLVDPMLGDKGSFESYANVAKNPILNLPCTLDEVLEDVDVLMVTHLHKDHFDDKARAILDKDIKVLCQPGNEDSMAESGFRHVEAIDDKVIIHGIEIYRTEGRHGRGEIEKHMGKVSGFVLSHPDEPTVYIIGDSIFNDDVKQAIDSHQPDYIITNSGGAFIPGYETDLILMNEDETLDVALYASNATILPVHMESLDHCTVNRASLQRAILSSDVEAERFKILLDGESLELN